jgi:hypothetical protein
MESPSTKLISLVFILFTSIASFRLIYHILIEYKKWIWPIIFFPVTIIAFCFVHWRSSRAYVFFFLLTLFASILVTSLLGQQFDTELLFHVLRVGLWPLVLLNYLASVFLT